MRWILVSLTLFVLLAGTAVAAPDSEWLAAFEVEHGYAPDADPDLLALGFTADECLAEHLTAREVSLRFDRPLTADEWRWQYFDRHYPPQVQMEIVALCCMRLECTVDNCTCLEWVVLLPGMSWMNEPPLPQGR
jgi:hypothetical protein